jgi:hypothetical protein
MTRMQTLGMDPMRMGRLTGRFNPKFCNVRGRSSFDLLAAYKKLSGGQRESFRLDAVAGEVLGEHKVHYVGTINDLWMDDPAKLVQYNLKDVELCVGIDAKEHIMEFYQMLAGYVGCAIEDTLSNSRIVDRYLLRYGHGKYVFPSKPESAVEGKSFQGATVFQPVSGLYEWVGVFDLKSLYPMIMVTLNASPEMKDDDGTLVAPNGVKFLASPDGLTRSIMMTLLNERDAMKAERKQYTEDDPRYHLLDLRQRVIKEIMNSYYGVSGYAKFRLYDPSFGSAVTSTGRAVIDYVRSIVASMGYTVLYGDTDSCMVRLPVTSEAEALALGKQIEEMLNSKFTEFAQTTLYAESPVHPDGQEEAVCRDPDLERGDDVQRQDRCRGVRDEAERFAEDHAGDAERVLETAGDGTTGTGDQNVSERDHQKVSAERIFVRHDRGAEQFLETPPYVRAPGLAGPGCHVCQHPSGREFRGRQQTETVVHQGRNEQVSPHRRDLFRIRDGRAPGIRGRLRTDAGENH